MTAETVPDLSFVETSEPSTPTAPFVPQPASVEETGLELSLLVDLMLKTIHFSGRPTGRQLSEQLAVPYQATEEIITFLRQEQAVEIVGSAGIGDQAYQYALTGRGKDLTEEALARSKYVGPTPVSFQLYTEVLQHQSARDIRIDRDILINGLSHLVLSRRALGALGPAFNSGRSVLIYGNSGNGKSTITVALERMLPGEVLIPFAVEVQGQIIKVFDPRMHMRVAPVVPAERRLDGASSPPAGRERRQDRRWALCRRPLVSVGGELTLQDLELRYSPLSQFYIAPLQWKANSGVLVIDDFGRQMIQPQELLNRWIVPMEQGVDHLSLHSGDTVELPFDVLLIFSSNVPPSRLGDEAFFRRIRHKVEIPNPTMEQYLEILRRVAEEHGVTYTDEGAQYLISTYYEQQGRQLKGCHPRDLMELLDDITHFYGEKPSLTPEWLDLACASYFVQVDDAA